MDLIDSDLLTECSSFTLSLTILSYVTCLWCDNDSAKTSFSFAYQEIYFIKHDIVVF